MNVFHLHQRQSRPKSHLLANACAQAMRLATIVLACGVVFTATGCGQASVGELVQRLEDPDFHVRYDALKGLETKGAEADAAVPQIAARLADTDEKVRYRAAKVLSKLGSAAAPAAEAVAKAMPKADTEMRYYLLKVLANIDKAAAVAVPQLADSLSDKDPKIRYYAAKSLGNWSGDEQRVISLVNDKIVAALRQVAATKTLTELNEDRKGF